MLSLSATFMNTLTRHGTRILSCFMYCLVGPSGNKLPSRAVLRVPCGTLFKILTFVVGLARIELAHST